MYKYLRKRSQDKKGPVGQNFCPPDVYRWISTFGILGHGSQLSTVVSILAMGLPLLVPRVIVRLVVTVEPKEVLLAWWSPWW